MNKKLFKKVAVVAAASAIFVGCQKQPGTVSSGVNGTARVYGLNPMTPDMWSSIPTFSEDLVSGRKSGLSATSLPSSFLLATPPVRDQGQIGSCTGFCGAETDEILNYYKTVASPVTSTGLDSAHGLTTAVSTQFSGTSLFGTSGALSPLFIYYVERCVINGGSIGSDPGANMVNICQTLQGLSSNTTSGRALTKKISGVTYTFSGDCTENLYAYPTSATPTSTQYTTPPNSTAIANAPSFKIAAQSGTTGSSGTTTHGYYVINSTNRVNDVKVAIYNKKPVMMGFNVYDNTAYTIFEGLGVTGYAPTKFVYNPLTSTGSLISGVSMLGGHAVPIVGYIDQPSAPGGGYFIVQNSWNTTWGYQGYFYMPYSVLASTTIVPAGNLYVAII